MNSAVTKLNQALDSQIILEASNIPEGLISEIAIGPNTIGTSELKVDSVETENIKDLNVTNAKLTANTIQSGKVSFFKSTEITGTGANQNIAHGLGRTPGLISWMITQQGTGDTVVEGTHDGTNVILNFQATTKLKVVAF
jgi:hypothetical protein